MRAHEVFMKRQLSFSIAILACTSFVAVRAAADPTSTEIAVGRRLFKEAVELENAQRWAEAAEKIRGAIAIRIHRDSDSTWRAAKRSRAVWSKRCSNTAERKI